METTNVTTQQENEIDLLELFFAVWRKIGWVILVAALLGGITFVYCKFFATPMYQAESTLFVLNRNNEDTLTTSDISSSNALLSDYQYFATSRRVVEQVINQLGLQDKYSYGKLSSEISVSVPTDSRILKIVVTDADPYLAKQIADALAEVMIENITDIMKAEAEHFESAELPLYPSSPATMKNTVIAGFLGAVLAIAVIVVIFLLDDTIKTEGDVERALKVPVLALIPISEEERAEKTSGRARRSAKYEKELGGR